MGFIARTEKGTALTETELDNNFLCHYPIGSLYLACSPAVDSPGALIGYGKWSKFAKGRALISASSIAAAGTDMYYSPGRGSNSPGNSPDFYYGSPSHALIAKELPKHTHCFNKDAQGGRGHVRHSGNYSGFDFNTGGTSIYRICRGGETGQVTFTNSPAKVSGNIIQQVGQPHNNLQPYIVVNIWKRDS